MAIKITKGKVNIRRPNGAAELFAAGAVIDWLDQNIEFNLVNRGVAEFLRRGDWTAVTAVTAVAVDAPPAVPSDDLPENEEPAAEETPQAESSLDLSGLGKDKLIALAKELGIAYTARTTVPQYVEMIAAEHTRLMARAEAHGINVEDVQGDVLKLKASVDAEEKGA